MTKSWTSGSGGKCPEAFNPSETGCTDLSRVKEAEEEKKKGSSDTSMRCGLGFRSHETELPLVRESTRMEAGSANSRPNLFQAQRDRELLSTLGLPRDARREKEREKCFAFFLFSPLLWLSGKITNKFVFKASSVSRERRERERETGMVVSSTKREQERGGIEERRNLISEGASWEEGGGNDFCTREGVGQTHMKKEEKEGREGVKGKRREWLDARGKLGG